MEDPRIKNEIAHGVYLAGNIAGQIWNWETPAGTIRWKRRVSMLTDLLEEGMKVLEIGCGTGYFTKELAKKCAELTAIDISPDLINIAKQKLTSSGVNFILDNAARLSFRDQTFDAVIGSSVLHHLDIEPALAEIYRVLSPGGLIAFTEPNMLNPQIALQKNIPPLKKAAGDSPDETAFVSWSLRKKLGKCGFKEIIITHFDFLHPGIPEPLIKPLLPLTYLAERIPLLKYLSGSLFIKARK